MITKVRFGAFKSHVDSELPLEPLTILVGANASGKTNAVEGLTLLSKITAGAEIGHSIESAEGNIRGESKYCAPFGSNEFSLGCDFESPLPDEGKYCRYEIDIRIEGIPIVQQEAIHFMDANIKPKELPLFWAKDPDTSLHSIKVVVNNFKRGGVKPRFDFNARIPVLFQLLPRISEHFKGYDDKGEAISRHKQVNQILLTSLSSITVLDPKPELIRSSGYVPVETKKMDSSGKNLSGVLNNLFQYQEKKKEILELLRSLPEHEIFDIDFINTPRNEVQLIVKESFHRTDYEVPLKLLSDGTIRLLVILATAFSMPEGGLLVIEEVDTSLHPSKVDRLLDKLMEVARNNKARLLVTTHNPALLDAVPSRNYNSVVICYREDETGNSKFIRLIDIPDIEEVLLRDKLGGLISGRLYDKYLRQKAEERIRHKDQIIIDWKKRMGVG